MREHSFDAEESALRPKSARIEEPVSDRRGRAASEGRCDVLGEAGLLEMQRAAGNGGALFIAAEAGLARAPLDPIARGPLPIRRCG